MERDKGIDYARTNDLTIDEIKACSVFDHVTNEEAGEIIETLKLFTKIAYDVYKKEQMTHENVAKNP
jgi:hypothetical protein